MIISVSRGQACRWSGGEKVTALSRMGRTWWHWLPWGRIHSLSDAPGGLYFTEISVWWLCYWIGLNISWKARRSDYIERAAQEPKL